MFIKVKLVVNLECEVFVESADVIHISLIEIFGNANCIVILTVDILIRFNYKIYVLVEFSNKSFLSANSTVSKTVM